MPRSSSTRRRLAIDWLGRGRCRPASAVERLEKLEVADRLLDQLNITDLSADGLPAEPRRTDDQDWNVTQRRVVQLLVAEVPAVHHGHHQIEQDRGGARTVSQDVERLLAVGRRHDLEPFLLQPFPERFANRGVVLHEEEAWRRRTRLRRRFTGSVGWPQDMQTAVRHLRDPGSTRMYGLSRIQQASAQTSGSRIQDLAQRVAYAARNGATGKRSVNVVPVSLEDTTAISPRWACAIWRTM